MAAKLLLPAIQTAKVNSSIRYQTEMWGEVGASYVKMGRYNDALQAAKSLATQEYQGADDGSVSIALDRIIRELVAAKQLDKVPQVAQRISHPISYGKAIDEEYTISEPMALTRLADEYSKAGQREKALKLLAQAAKLNPSLPEIAVAYAAAGQQNQALQVLSQGTHTDDTSSMFSFIRTTAAYAKIGQKSKALQRLAQAKDKAKQKAESGSSD
ncbi:MAG TPA: hypothetical protein V6C50_07380, partial [Crinalium sp.]